MRILIKPLSVNKLFQGRRFRTRDYDVYEAEVLLLVRHWKPVIYPQMIVKLQIGLSNRSADLDNCCKALFDILAKKYGFNDAHIYRIEAQKEIVPKGSEFIDVEILPFTP